MNLRRYTVLSISLLLFSFPIYKLVQACSDGPDPYDYYPSFFQPAVLKATPFVPFHYTAQIKYYDDWYDYSSEETIPDANIAAWKSFTGNAVAEADLDSFIYKYPYASLGSLYYHIEKGKPLQVSREVERNSFTQWLRQKKDLETLGYLMFAKQVEERIYMEGDWDAVKMDTAKVSRLIMNGLQLHAAAKSDFIKERYAYQVLRLTHVAEKPRQTLELFQKLVGDKALNGEISVRNLGLKAGALFRLKRKAEAAYLYSKVFDASDKQKRSSYLSFDWSVTDIKPVLALCKTPHEKAIVYLMDGLNEYGEGLPQLQAAYSQDPQVRGLDVLMLREINKLEDRYQQAELLKQRGLRSSDWTSQYEGEYDYLQKESIAIAGKTKPYVARLNDFARKVVAEDKTRHNAFWQLSSAYLAFISGDMPATRNRLDEVEITAANARERDLHEVLSTLYTIRSTKRMDAAADAVILPKLQWLEKRAENDNHLAKTYRDLMSTVLTIAYLKSGDTAKAIYCLSRLRVGENGIYSVYDDFTDLPGSLLEHSSPDKLREIAAFAAKGNKTPTEAWLTKGTPYTSDVITELEGTKYLRMFQFGKAADVFGRSSQKVLARYLLPDPFLAHIRDKVDPDALDSVHMLSKLAFAQKMAALQGKEDAASLFQYGCGLYSISYYGKAHRAYDYYRHTSDEMAYYSTPQRKALPTTLQDYYSVSSAEQIFIKAALKTPDPEFKAKCLWMAGKCWQKRAPLSKADLYYSEEEENIYYQYSLRNPYFARLREGGMATTPFMQKAYNTCVYLQDYVRTGKK
jgi:hypothetical protein